MGRDFQADIPPIQEQQNAYSDSHNALLLWTVQDELQHPDNQLRSKTQNVNINLLDDRHTISLTGIFFVFGQVEALVMMAHSSVVPGGGASPESALQILSECSGDFLVKAHWLFSLVLQIGSCRSVDLSLFLKIRH